MTNNLDNSYTISEVATKLNLSDKTLRRWEESQRFTPSRTLGNQRRYSLDDIQILDAIKNNLIESQADLLTLSETASLAGVNPSTIDRWVKEGKLHPFVTASRTFFLKSRLLSQLQELKTFSPEPAPLSTTPPPPPPLHPPVSSNTALTPTPNPNTNTFSHTWSPLSLLSQFALTLILLAFYHFFFTPSLAPISPSSDSALSPDLTYLASIMDQQGNLTAPHALKSPLLIFSPASAPLDPIPGSLYFDTSSRSLRFYSDTWINLGENTSVSSTTSLAPIETLLVSGARILKKNSSSLTVTHKDITPSTPVTITFTADYSPAKKYWLEQTNGSFTLYTDYPVAADTSFTYLILTPSSPNPTF